MKLWRHNTLKLPQKIGITAAVGDRHGIYVGDQYKNIYALEPTDCRVRWEVAAKGYAPTDLCGEILILSSVRHSAIRGVDVRTGETRWIVAAQHGHCVPWRNGLLRVHETAGRYVSLDPRSGAIVEEGNLDEYSFFMGDALAIVRMYDSPARCIDLRDRSILWEGPIFEIAREAGGPTTRDLHAGGAFPHRDDTVVVHEGAGVAAFRLSTGATLWTHAIPGRPTGYVTVEQGCVIATTPDHMICLDVGSGEIRWMRDLAELGSPPHPPRVVFQDAFVTVGSDRLCLLDAQDGRTLATHPGRELRSAASTGDRLVVLLCYGRINVFGVDRPSAASKAPKGPPRSPRLRSGISAGGIAFERALLVTLPGFTDTSRVVVGPDGVFASGSGAGPIKLSLGDYRVRWQLPSETSEIALAVGSRALAADWRRNLVHAFRSDDGGLEWEAHSQRGQAWIHGEQMITAPPGAAEIHVLDAGTGRRLRTLPRPLDRVLGVGGGLVALASVRELPDSLDSIRDLTEEPGLLGSLVNAFGEDDPRAVRELLRIPSGHFAVLDLEQEKVVWDQELEADLSEMAGIEPELRLQVVAIDASWLVLVHQDHLWGVSLLTGAIAWHVKLDNRTTLHYDGAYVWAAAHLPGAVQCIDVETGAVRLRTSRATGARLLGSYRDFVVSNTVAALDFFHPRRDAVRLRLRNGARQIAAAPPDLILAEGTRLRVLREVPTD